MRLLVNDTLSQLGERTFWHDLKEWFGCDFAGGDYATLAQTKLLDASLIIRNGSYFGPLQTSVPTISLIQDIMEGEGRKLQDAVILSSKAVVFNSTFTYSKYKQDDSVKRDYVIPLPVDFSLFEPGNALGLQQALSLPDNCICWVGASQGAAGEVKGWPLFRRIARLNPDLNFVAVFKDALPDSAPPNMRLYLRLPQPELAKVMGACRVGLCTSKTESQHLAGIEMGACGLPLVVPPVGAYWKREDLPGLVVQDDVPSYVAALRSLLAKPADPQQTREYWKREFDKPVIRRQWEELVDAVEHPDRSDS